MSSSTSIEGSDALRDRLRAALGAQFEVSREIGRGGMGIVYAGRDLQLDRAVAIKVLAPDANASARERFLREARTAARLSHPNVVAVYRADQVSDLAFFVMEYVDGTTLEEQIENGRTLPARRGVLVLRDAASALAHAHSKGVIHRDVKPSNIMIESGSGRVVLTDFGIAHAEVTAENAAELTQTGQILGSISYISPEQSAGESIDARTDVYSLGVVGYRILSGRVPFDGSAGAVLLAHITKQPVPLAALAPDVADVLCEVIERAMAKSPDARFETAAQMARTMNDVWSAVSSGGELDRAPIAATTAGHTPTAPARFSDTEASLVWRRASELEANATGRHAGVAPREPTVDEHRASDGLSEAQVRAAAIEAGIAPPFVYRALTELESRATGVAAEEANTPRDGVARALLGSDQRTLTVSRTVDASVIRVRGAMLEVLQDSTFALLLRDASEDSSRGETTLVFDLPASGTPQVVLGGPWVNLRTSLGSRRVAAKLTRATAVGSSGERCEVVMRADVIRGRRGNIIAMVFLDGLAGLLGSGAGWAVGAKVAVAASAVAWPIGLAAGIALGALGTRKMYVGALKKAERELEGAIDAVEAHLRTIALLGRSDGGKLTRRSDPGGDDAPYVR